MLLDMHSASSDVILIFKAMILTYTSSFLNAKILVAEMVTIINLFWTFYVPMLCSNSLYYVCVCMRA